MTKWSETKLGKIAQEVRELYEPSNRESISYVGLEHISQGDLSIVGLGLSNETVSTKRKFKSGDILFGTLRPYFRKVAKPNFDGVCSTDISVLRAKKGYSQDFLFYLIASQPLIDYASVTSNGTKMPRAKWKVLAKTDWMVPEYPEQQRIASILSAYDDLIENNNKRITLLEQMAKQTYKEWFVRMRFPGYENAEFEKGVPKGWEVKPLSSVANILMGQSPKSEFYNEEGIGLPFHQGVGSYGERFPIHDIFCSINGRQAKEGDILFSVRAPVGRINIADKKLIIGRGLGAIRHKQNLQSYLFYLLNYYFQIEDVIGNGAIFNSVGKDELNKFKVLHPNENLDKKFNDLVAPIDKQLHVLVQLNQLLKQTRDMLLPRLISGKLRVKEVPVPE